MRERALAGWTRSPIVAAMNETHPAILEAERAGFDLSLVDSNLRHSYEERVLQHAAALEFALELAAAGAAYYAQSAPVAEPAR